MIKINNYELLIIVTLMLCSTSLLFSNLLNIEELTYDFYSDKLAQKK